MAATKAPKRIIPISSGKGGVQTKDRYVSATGEVIQFLE